MTDTRDSDIERDAVPSPPRRGDWRLLAVIISFAVLIVGQPFTQGQALEQWFMRAAFSGVLVFSVMAVSAGRRAFALAIVLGAVTLAAEWAKLAVDDPMVEVASRVCWLLFLLFAIFSIAAREIFQGKVTMATIYAATVVYLMLGLLWAMLYALSEFLAPGSLRVEDGAGSADALGVSQLLYYSFATLTTLGYGDITPAAAITRSLSTIEAILGVLYPAVIIARLVGMHTAAVAHGRRDMGASMDRHRTGPSKRE